MSELIIEESNSEAPEFTSFMDEWGDEIERIFPHYSEEDASYGEVMLLKKDDKYIGVFVYLPKGEELHISIDYVVPPFRDMGVGEDFFRQKLGEFKKHGFAVAVALTANEKHTQYLKSLGFVNSSKHPHWYELELN
ncbi:MAG: hypothetical protein HUJ25_04375 [Crocinitomicaceae bacterium]|nr:hypothetical protein [Crocinitomicaceae bacterium]